MDKQLLAKCMEIQVNTQVPQLECDITLTKNMESKKKHRESLQQKLQQNQKSQRFQLFFKSNQLKK